MLPCCKAIGKQLTCVFVDHGLLRKNEREQVCEVFGEGGQFDINFVCVDARERFLQQAGRCYRAGAQA